MIRVLKVAGSVLLAALLLGGAWLVDVGFLRPYSIDLFFNRVFLRFALHDPELVSSLHILEPLGIHYYDRRLTDASPAHERREADFARHELDILESYDRTRLTPDRQLSFDILHYFLADAVDGSRFLYYDYPVSTFFGVQDELPSLMIGRQPVESAGDARDYIARLRLFGWKFDGVLRGLRLREGKGIYPQKFLVDKTLAGMRAFAGQPPERNPLYTSFADKLARINDLPAAQRDALLAQARASLREVVYPAYGRLIDHMQGLQAKVTRDDGVWSWPGGDAFYAWKVRHETTTDLTPARIHLIGLAEVDRIEDEMDAILRAQGYARGSVGERMAALGKEERFLYADSDEGRRQCLADFQKILDEANASLGPYFDEHPKLPLKVQAVPAFKEKTAAAAYYEPGALDGSRPGTFFVNLRALRELPKFSMRTVAYHEGIPGHHFQISLAQELRGEPVFRQVIPFTAYHEGWALYAERLAFEIGLEKDPYDNLGRLRDELFRAVRLVVDTGLHYQHWSREQAIDYMRSHTGMGDTEVVAEIERYLADPGQALAYKIGMLKILELRQRAQQRLGARFDIRRFHDVVLGAGAMPLPVLEARVDAWIAQQAAAPPAPP
ncbi:MAG: DUF885 domain-containing protein [Nevskia sp.]|nr:DUF885 domain-containing protein [Nevskia sp.]